MDPGFGSGRRAPELALHRADPEEIAQFKEWLIAKELVNRCNRNLLQYSAGLAVLLGIGGATTGVFALADSLGKGTQRSLGWVHHGALLLGFALAVILGALVLESLARRRRAERDADERLRQLPVDFLVAGDRLAEPSSEPVPR